MLDKQKSVQHFKPRRASVPIKPVAELTAGTEHAELKEYESSVVLEKELGIGTVEVLIMCNMGNKAKNIVQS